MLHPSDQVHKTNSRIVRLRQLFGLNRTEEELNLSAGIARLFVLYEDIRLEITGMISCGEKYERPKPERMPFERLERNARFIYFLRKSVGTLREFSECFGMLESSAGFSKLIKSLHESDQQEWELSSNYFKETKVFWKNIRNDLGGHFSHDASRYVLQTLENDAFGRIEAQLSFNGQIGFSLPFAWEIASTAFLRHLEADTKEAKVKLLVEKVTEAYARAIFPTISIIGRRAWNA